MPLVLLTYYCALILVASIVGGMIPVWFQLTHRWMQFAVSFVAGVMLGIGLLHMLPHAIDEAIAATTPGSTMEAVRATLLSLLAGVLAMFFIERFFSYHHHDVPDRAGSREQGAGSKDHRALGDSSPPAPRSPLPAHHGLSWSGAALGLALHSVLNGVALAAAVQHGSHGSWLAGFGTFLVIVLHKPFDAMTIGMLMARGGWSMPWRHTINVLFSLAIPIGALLFYFGLMSEATGTSAATPQWYVASALAFSAGTFVCISLSDLLPELQFHSHDRVKLSIALVLGLAVAHAAAWLESAAHAAHAHPNVVGTLRVPSPGVATLDAPSPRLPLSADPPLHALPSLPDHRGRRFRPVHAVASPKTIGSIQDVEDRRMSGSNQRTWQQYRTGHFLCTVQLDPAADRRAMEHQHELAAVARRLIGLMDSHRLPTTWAVSDPAHSAATPLIVRSAVEHELAILGDSYWVGPAAGRTRFARELARRVLQARTARIAVSSLVPRVASVERHIDLIVKQQISAICGLARHDAERPTPLPRALHYGVWELPVSRKLPIPSTWLSRGGWSTWRRIRLAAREAATFHLLIDVPEITDEGRRAEKTVAWLMRRVAELRDRGLISVQTLRLAAERLASVPPPVPQHSILRRAA